MLQGVRKGAQSAFLEVQEGLFSEKPPPAPSFSALFDKKRRSFDRSAS
jgi:hypothetical protein